VSPRVRARGDGVDSGGKIEVMTARESLHALVDALPEDRLGAAREASLATVDDPLLAMLDAAPLDDEPLTPEETAALDEARGELRGGEPMIPLEDVEREYGIAP
jgi:hypothetical protein